MTIAYNGMAIRHFATHFCALRRHFEAKASNALPAILHMQHHRGWALYVASITTSFMADPTYISILDTLRVGVRQRFAIRSNDRGLPVITAFSNLGRSDRIGRIGARWIRHARCLPIAWMALSSEGASAETLDLNAFTTLARRCGSTVAVSTLAAVAKTESGFRTLVVSDNRTRKAQTFHSIDAAAAAADGLIAQGHSIDLGLMQINSANLRKLGYTARDALDPCKSVSGGALILTRNFVSSRNAPSSQIALRHALSRYNTGNPRDGYRNGYVRRVEQAARALLPMFARAGSVAIADIAMPVALMTRPASATAKPATPTAANQRWWDVWGSVEQSLTSTGARPDDIQIF